MAFEKKNRDARELPSRTRIKSFFKKYIFVIILVEIGIFVVCWIYQLGLFKEDRMGPVTRPFPWQSYFLFAFLVPVCMTFFWGLFMEYKGIRRKKQENTEEKSRVSEVHRSVCRLLLFFVATMGFIFFLDEILNFLAYMGSVARGPFLVAGLVITGIGVVAGGFWMFSRYKFQKKALQNHYRARVLHHLSMVEEKNSEDSFQGFSENPSSGAPPATGRKQDENL